MILYFKTIVNFSHLILWFIETETHCQEFEAGVETSVVEEIEEFNHLNLETSRLEEEFNIFSSPNQTNLEKHKERIKCLEDKKQFLSEILPKAKKTFRAASDDADWHWDNVIKHGREITKTPFPPWFLDLKRPWSVFDFAISKGIFVLNFLRTRSDNLAAAIGTEAYKDYMVLIPQFGIHMEKLKLNKMNRELNQIKLKLNHKHIFFKYDFFEIIFRQHFIVNHTRMRRRSHVE